MVTQLSLSSWWVNAKSATTTPVTVSTIARRMPVLADPPLPSFRRLALLQTGQTLTRSSTRTEVLPWTLCIATKLLGHRLPHDIASPGLSGPTPPDFTDVDGLWTPGQRAATVLEWSPTSLSLWLVGCRLLSAEQGLCNALIMHRPVYILYTGYTSSKLVVYALHELGEHPIVLPAWV